MATFNEITSELSRLIKTKYPRFKDPERIEVVQSVDMANLGYEDCFVIKPEPYETVLNLSCGKIAHYNFDLIYYKKNHQDEVTDIAAFADALERYLLAHRHNIGYWTSFDTETVFEVEVPEEYEGPLDGFTTSFTFITYVAGDSQSSTSITSGMPIGLLLGLTYES